MTRTELKLVKMQCTECGKIEMRVNRGTCKCGEGYMVHYYPRLHYLKIMALIEADPHSDDAASLRLEIAELEQSDPTLIVQRIDVMAAHSKRIGDVPKKARKPEGVMLT